MDYQQAYAAAADPFTAIVRRGRDWGAGSPCEGWSAADVLHHVRTTQREFLASHGLDQDWPADRADPVADWLAHDARVRALLSEESIGKRAIDGYFGPSTIGDLMAGFYGWDRWCTAGTWPALWESMPVSRRPNSTRSRRRWPCSAINSTPQASVSPLWTSPRPPSDRRAS